MDCDLDLREIQGRIVFIYSQRRLSNCSKGMHVLRDQLSNVALLSVESDADNRIDLTQS